MSGMPGMPNARGGRRIGRAVVAGLVVLSVLGAEAGDRSEVKLEMGNENRCPGIAGKLKRDRVEVTFEAFATPTGAESRIRTSTGEVLTEIIVDSVAGVFEYRAGGVTLSDNLTPEEAERAASVFEREEAALIAEHLWPALQGKGYSPKSREMASLAANLTGYEVVSRRGPPNAQTDACFGCCGPGCWGCTGCYTGACAAHDACVARYGHANPLCATLLHMAAISAWCCRGVDMGSLC